MKCFTCDQPRVLRSEFCEKCQPVGYRQLKSGELVQSGDECRRKSQACGPAAWGPTQRPGGMQNPEFVYRRAVFSDVIEFDGKASSLFLEVNSNLAPAKSLCSGQGAGDYRILEPGEVLMRGDECRSRMDASQPWRPTARIREGQSAEFIYRRFVPAVAEPPTASVVSESHRGQLRRFHYLMIILGTFFVLLALLALVVSSRGNDRSLWIPPPEHGVQYVREVREVSPGDEPLGLPQEAGRVEYTTAGGQRVAEVWVRVVD